MQSIIDKKASVYIGSPATKENLWDAVNNRPTVYAREIQQLESVGYKRIEDFLFLRDNERQYE